MDFFESQDDARRTTTRLIVLFTLAVVAIGCTLYAVAVVATGFRGTDQVTGELLWQFDWAEPERMLQVAVATLLVVGGGSLYKSAQLRRGGGRFVAESLGGRLLHADSGDPAERRVLNVVEEMAIASGMAVPPVYMLDQEPGINAFAAGFDPADAVVAVTRGSAEQLSRDELQGVVAHEFSHILNGDMRLNIRLMGILHGILLIGIIGYFVLRSSLFSRRSERGLGAALLFVGASLAAIGALGTFFGNMIKASVSRQREFLADASAVQFTRNPDGLAGALKKIGGFEEGSVLASPSAPEVSHAFFARGLAAGLSSVFATHPPLAERILRLDRDWRPAEARAPESSSAERDPAARGFAAAAGPPNSSPNAAAAVRQIGSPTPAHLAYASNLLAQLPQRVVAAAHETYGARALVYALLIVAEPEVRSRQLRALSQHADPAVHAETLALLPEVDGLDRSVALPVVDMALPALRELTGEQYAAFRESVASLMAVDDRLDLFEWALQRVLLTHLAPHFGRERRHRVRFSGLRQLGPQLSITLSTLAQIDPSDPLRVEQAFEAGAAQLGARNLTLLPRERCDLAVLDQALFDLADATPDLKREIVAACAAVVCSDQELSVYEGELLRAVCDTLGCPMPPLRLEEA